MDVSKEMYDLSIELCSELEEYIKTDFQDNFQDFLCVKNNIGSHITQLNELLKQL